MSDLNTVVHTGRLTRDPELRRAGNGSAVVTLRVAVQKEREPGSENRGAAFWNVEAWGALAESCGARLVKGRRIGVEGALDHREWVKDGTPRQVNFIRARRINFLDPPPTPVAGSAPDDSPAADGPAASRPPDPPRPT